MIIETICVCEKEVELIINEYFYQFKDIFKINKIEKRIIKEEESCYYLINLIKNNFNIKWKEYFNIFSNIFDENNYNKTKIKNMWLIKIEYFNENDNIVIIGIKIKND